MNEKNEHEWRKKFSNRLTSFIELVGINQTDLSKKSGISETSISRYVNGEQTPSLYHAVKIARAIDIPLDTLTDV